MERGRADRLAKILRPKSPGGTRRIRPFQGRSRLKATSYGCEPAPKPLTLGSAYQVILYCVLGTWGGCFFLYT